MDLGTEEQTDTTDSVIPRAGQPISWPLRIILDNAYLVDTRDLSRDDCIEEFIKRI